DFVPGAGEKNLLKPLRETAEAISRELGFTVREGDPDPGDFDRIGFHPRRGNDHILRDKALFPVIITSAPRRTSCRELAKRTC
ncbi:hypothetical protein CKQ90_29460, partial [Klebsiella pneumoniae]